MPHEASDEELSLREYVRLIRRRKLVVSLAVVVVVTVALVSSFLQTPVYASSAEIVLRARAGEDPFNADTGQRNDPQRALQTEIRILKGQPVRQTVRDKLGYSASVSATAAGQTDVIVVTAENTVPRRAADIANAYASSYLDFKRKQTVDELLAAANEVQKQLDDIQRQISVSTDPARSLLIQQQAVFDGQLDQLQVSAALRTGGAQLVSEAEVPTSPVRPKPLRTGIVALVLGVLLGMGLAFLVEYLDDTIKTKADFERVAPTLPLLGLIPAVPAWKKREEARLISVSEPNSTCAEAYRTLRTSIQFLGMDRVVGALQFTSPSAAEGKTTTVANLAVAMARAGVRVVIVCCDLRRPRVHKYFGLSNSVGFTSVLLGEVGLSQALQQVPGVDRLHLLASGPLPPNPSELLSSKRAGEVLKSLRSAGGILLLDSPPVLPVSDSLVVARHVDATLLVTSAGGTSRKDAARAVELLQQVDAPLVGAILNGVKADDAYGYSYGYEYTSYQAETTMDGNGRSNGTSNRVKKRAKKTGSHSS